MKIGRWWDMAPSHRVRQPGALGPVGAALALTLLVVALLEVACTKSGGAKPGEVIEPEPVIAVELPLGDRVQLPFTISGWAVDTIAQEGPGIDVVQILDEGCEGVIIGVAEYGLERTDIQTRHGEQFLYSGWQFAVERLRPGDHTLAARAASAGGDGYSDCQILQVTVE